MSLLWETAEMIEAMGARPFGKMPQGITGISIDTRTIKPGEAFFAIKGDRFDGHDFVTAAMKAGAAMAVVSEEKLVAFGHLRFPILVVSNVLEALARLGIASRARSRAKIIAVTGSAGKTTTKEMLRAVLSPSGKVHASIASFNNHWGVPLTLARMPTDTRYGVFEIGMNHAGEIAALVKLVKPHIAIITTIAPAHLGNFASIDDIARAKAEIFTGVGDGGAVILNRDNKHFAMLEELAQAAKVATILSFGTKRGSDFHIRSITPADGGQGSDVSAKFDGLKLDFSLPVAGEHMVLNAVAALGAAQRAGANVELGAKALSRIEAEKGRGRRYTVKLPRGSFTLIDESYNANPGSMEAALGVLANTEVGARGRRIAVLGDMLELGEHSQKLHKAVAKAITAKGIDLVYLAGTQMAVLAEVLEPKLLAGHFEDAQSLGDALAGSLKAGDAIMVKASNGLRFSSVVERILTEYDKRPGGRT